jgi:hypothetical protein
MSLQELREKVRKLEITRLLILGHFSGLLVPDFHLHGLHLRGGCSRRDLRLTLDSRRPLNSYTRFMRLVMVRINPKTDFTRRPLPERPGVTKGGY